LRADNQSRVERIECPDVVATIEYTDWINLVEGWGGIQEGHIDQEVCSCTRYVPLGRYLDFDRGV